MHPLPPAWGGGGVIFLEKSLLGGIRNFYLGGEGYIVGGRKFVGEVTKFWGKKKKLHNTSIKTISGIAILI